MHRDNAFTRADMLAAIVVTIAFIGVSHVLVGADKAPPKTLNRGSQAQVQLQRIHKGMMLHARTNLDNFPGIDRDGKIADAKIEAEPSVYGTKSTDGAEPVYRMALLLRAKFVKPEDLISPFEEKGKKTAAAPGKNMTHDNFSFALLRIDAQDKRAKEWKATDSSMAAAASDRNIGKGAGKNSRSIVKSGVWEGAVVYNDNHVMIEKNPLKKTKYANPGDDGDVSNDDLFADDKTAKGETGADAAMVYQDAKTYVEQK